MSYTVTPSDLGRDRACILGLWKRNFPTVSDDRYGWLYEAGPATGWVLRSGEGRIVGATGLMRRTMKVGDRTLSAGQAVDLNVDQDHRSAGPALSLGRAVAATAAEHELALIYAFPDAKSGPVLRRVGYKPLGDLGRWAKPLRSVEYLPGWLRRGLPRKALAVAADSLLRLKSPETFYRRPAGLRVWVTDHFDACFDALWQKASPQFPIVGQRTSDYLNWRFGRCPHAVHRVFCLSGTDEELRAYLVYSRREAVVHVNDFFFADPLDLDRLLAEFLRRMREERAEAVITVFFGSDVVCRRLERFGFWRRPGQWKTMVYVDRQQLGDLGQVLDEQNWFVTRADIDTDD